MSLDPPAALAWAICRGTTSRREHTRLSGRYVRGRVKVTLMSCGSCSHMQFFEGWHDE